jgi:hypothetical protein
MQRRALRAALGLAAAISALFGAETAIADEDPCAVVEVSPPPPSMGTDATELRSEAEDEAQKVEDQLRRERRRIVIALAVTEPEPVVCHVSGTVRDAETGTVLAVIESSARAAGQVPQGRRREMAHAGVRRVVRNVPDALRVK